MFNLKLIDNAAEPLALPGTPRAAAKFLAQTLVNKGYAPGQDSKVDWKHFIDALLLRDTVSMTHIRPLIQTSIQMVLREPLEPIMSITPLFTRVESQGADVKVLGGVICVAVYAEDIPEGGLYPEVMVQVGPGLQIASIGKCGLQVSFTDEALRYTNWDVMGINLRAIRNALVRHKEQKAIAFLRNYGVTLFDNLAPTQSIFGVTTGRGMDGEANGSVMMDDLFKAIAHSHETGYVYDIMLVNPQVFYLWIADPVLRGFAQSFGGGVWFQQWQGNPGPLDPWSNGNLGSAGPTLGNRVMPFGSPSGETPTGIAGREHGMTSTPTLPNYFGWPIRMMVSPFVPYDAETGLTDIYLLSSGNVGIHLVDEDPVEVQWRDEDREIVKMKVRERYSFQIANEGMGIGVMRNIPLVRNYWDGEIHWQTPTELTPIESGVPLAV